MTFFHSLDILLLLAAIAFLISIMLEVSASSLKLAVTAAIFVIITLLTPGCASRKQPLPPITDPPIAAVQTRQAAIETTQELSKLATKVADEYIAAKSGNTDWGWNIASGVRAYQIGKQAMKTYADVKNVVTMFGAGKKEDKTFAIRLAELFASSTAKPETKSIVIAQAVERAAATP